jgi:hypothetical protein
MGTRSRHGRWSWCGIWCLRKRCRSLFARTTTKTPRTSLGKRGPRDDFPERPKRARVRILSGETAGGNWCRKEAHYDLSEEAEQPEIDETEAKRNAAGKTPSRRLQTFHRLIDPDCRCHLTVKFIRSARPNDGAFGFSDAEAPIAKLGKHTTGKGCRYIGKLGGVDEIALEALAVQSVAAIRARYPNQGNRPE